MFQAGKNCVQTATRIESTSKESDARHPDTGRDPLNACASFSAAQRIQTSDRENHFLLGSLKSRCMIQAAERETEGDIDNERKTKKTKTQTRNEDTGESAILRGQNSARKERRWRGRKHARTTRTPRVTNKHTRTPGTINIQLSQCQVHGLALSGAQGFALSVA